MSRLIWGGLILAVVEVMSPGMTEAGLFRCLFGHNYCTSYHLCGDCCRVRGYCQVCRQPPTLCTCTTFKPIVETHYVKQRCVSYRDVCETHHRQETCVSKVPVTTYQDVTVDAGCYQRVWVPKFVTKKVPRTVYQDRVSTRMVPYQVRRRVPQVSTRWIPQRTIRYVPQQTGMMVHPGCTGCATPAHVAPPATVPKAPPASTPTPAEGKAQSMLVPNPTPDPQFAQKRSGNSYNEWMPIEPVHPHRQPVFSSSRKSGRFVPAPSAAAVWRSRRGL